LGTCSLCKVRWKRTNDVYDCGGRMTSLPAPKKKSLKMENFKPEKKTHLKLFEGPYRSRCFTKIITSSSFTEITASSSFADIIASSSFAKIIASSSFAKVIASSCSLNRQHLEMPGMPQTSSRTYCLWWDKFQQQWDVFQLMETHAYTFTAGGIYFSDMQRKEGEHHGIAEQTGGSTSRTCSADGGIAFTFTAGGFYFSDIQRKEGDALSRVTAMFATTAVHSFITIKSSQD
jgi:predicted nucleic acid-binding Zn ribbon protein